MAGEDDGNGTIAIGFIFGSGKFFGEDEDLKYDPSSERQYQRNE